MGFLSENSAQTSYDVVPYDSYPFAQTHPAHLMTLGRLFGMQAPDIATARVLELGCASGWNIIPIAADYPHATVVGVDLSSVQIEEGRRHIQALGLDNIRLNCASITDIDETWGTFDYIICHGVLSWVPEAVRDHIFKVMKHNLTANGIAYVSYNTLPGWNQVRSVRDMMRYHADNFSDPVEKASQALSILKFAADNTNPGRKGYLEILKEEMTLLEGHSKSYILHEHLEAENHQYYFHQFAGQAKDNGLAYLGDAMLPSMYVGNLAPNASKVLGEIEDIVRLEQYMDFVTNRRFRSTLLCHDTIALDRTINPEKLSGYSFVSHLAPQETEGKETGSSMTFVGPQTATAHSALDIAIFQVLYAERGKPVSLPDLIQKVAGQLRSTDHAAIRRAFLNNLCALVLGGSVSLHTEPGKQTTTISDKPITSKVSRYRATFSNRVINGYHGLVTLSEVDRILIQYLDGTQDIESICKHMLERVEKQEINVTPADGLTVTQTVEGYVRHQLSVFRDLGLLFG
ncbi:MULTISPECIES: methyltransferase regulatory domain-containing protein [unclassified Haematospirillum]|uniref:methyltransferase regulatory domain-containing protein n=1 Tax=unclassified Haematospirillum TaxID=2622088 RepID=UPI00143C9658|nr:MULTISPECIES: class I SAM-dependent methyltransferase [unclassified Haematospirillum]NKD55665.1 methyltransferase domain-containing protein [Haematospirillum sp. H4890]NKD75190.1 methyltransferase domain-containing protein [Haematospirillum sp. H4485]